MNDLLPQLVQVDELFKLTVVGTTAAAVGTLIGLFLKEVLLARSFEDWKARRSLDSLYRRYRDPLVLAAVELCNRLGEVCDNYPPDYLQSTNLRRTAKMLIRNSADDPYYQHYKLLTTVYRLCALFGWLELYRQDAVFLETGHVNSSKILDSCLASIRSDLAEGNLNRADDWFTWRDALIFREEQRAIGESMIIDRPGGRVVMGYLEFVSIMEKRGADARIRWFRTAANLFVDPEDRDFRVIRMQRLVVHLADLVEVLAPDRLEPHHKEGCLKYAGAVHQRAA